MQKKDILLIVASIAIAVVNAGLNSILALDTDIHNFKYKILYTTR